MFWLLIMVVKMNEGGSEDDDPEDPPPLPSPLPLLLLLDESDEPEELDRLDDPDESDDPSPLPLPLLLLSEPDEPDESDGTSLDADEEDDDEHAGRTRSSPVKQTPQRINSVPSFARNTQHTAAGSASRKSHTPGIPHCPVPVWSR